ncbi:MAG TPA: HipA family kinase [Candidatus Binatus sp.]|nr:HipA family kinase [Candidatus Binatus sp.]
MKVVDLIEEGEEVTPPQGVVYSTHPRRTLAQDGHVYFVKGPDLNVVVAEVVSHLLAQQIELQVPEFALAKSGSTAGFLFASREVQGFRAVDSWLAAGKVRNPTLVQLMHLFDVLVANRDRNIGNLIGETIRGQHSSELRLVAIDFEKAEALRGNYPLTTVPTIPPGRLRPSGILGTLLQNDHTAAVQFAAVERINRDDILGAFGKLEAVLGLEIEWKENSAQLVAQRARDIRRLLEEVWR